MAIIRLYNEIAAASLVILFILFKCFCSDFPVICYPFSTFSIVFFFFFLLLLHTAILAQISVALKVVVYLQRKKGYSNCAVSIVFGSLVVSLLEPHGSLSPSPSSRCSEISTFSDACHLVPDRVRVYKTYSNWSERLEYLQREQ